MNISKDKAKQNLFSIYERMQKAEQRFGVLNKKPVLVGVSKTYDANIVTNMLEAGLRVYGENRVQEALGKWPKLKQKYPDVKLHLIGPLQTNKVRDAIAFFDVIETLDREKLAKKLRTEMDLAGKQLPIFVQVNIGNEEQKAGIAISEVVEFVKKCKEVYKLDVIGLMCIPPISQPVGSYFAQMVELAKLAGVENISMGMSKDFETAIAMGATYIRVGSALFGERK